MNWEALDTRIRRTLALGILAGLVAVALWGIALPVAHSLSPDDASRNRSLKELARARGLAEADPMVVASLKDAEASPAWQRLYDGKTPELALVQLQADLRQVFGDSISTMATLPPANKGELVQIGVRLSAAMPMDRLAENLAKLSQLPKMVRIRNVLIQGPDVQAPDSNPSLSVQAEVVGYLPSSSGAAP